MNRPVVLTTAAAGGAWLAALAGWTLRLAAVPATLVVVGGALGVVRRRTPAGPWLVVGVVVVAGAWSGAAAAGRAGATREAIVAAGTVDVVGVVADEPVPWDDGFRFVIGVPTLPPIAVDVAGPPPTAGDTVQVRGRMRPGAGTVRGDPVAGTIDADELVVVAGASDPLRRAANMMRHRVRAVLGSGDAATRGLLAGFLIGDTSQVPAGDLESLRRAGLTHFVAVSGSNVALFLVGWWLVLAPLAGPRVRAALGLVGIGVFAFVTRWEASVLRASGMMALVLVGRLAGVPIEPAVALGGGVAGLLLVSGDLAVSAGFQLSVAATVGVMVGVRRVRRRSPRWVWSTLGAAVGAQVAVLPLVLLHFGSVPLLSPVANLLAAPLVTAATALGGVAVATGATAVLDIAEVAASGVLGVARWAAAWPQLDAAGAAGFAGLVVAGRWRPLRLVVPVGLLVAVIGAAMPPQVPLGPVVTFMAIGQGDAVLVRDGDAAMLVDGGSDPVVLAEALHRNGVHRLQVLVASHGDLDHVGGLVGVFDTVDVAWLWVPDHAALGAVLTGVVADAGRRGIPVARVTAGWRVDVGRIQATALGPQRRYASDNDGAVVTWLDAGGPTALLTADIEAVAQQELPPLHPDLLQVPHHGSATTDLGWLIAVDPDLAVVSVGPNSYGHPNADLMTRLRGAGVPVITTWDSGDITVPLW